MATVKKVINFSPGPAKLPEDVRVYFSCYVFSHISEERYVTFVWRFCGTG